MITGTFMKLNHKVTIIEDGNGGIILDIGYETRFSNEEAHQFLRDWKKILRRSEQSHVKAIKV